MDNGGSGAARDDRRPVGLVLARPAQILGAEPFYHEFVAGVERALGEAGYGLLLHVVTTHEDEIACYRRWADGNHVSGVFLVDLSADDIRLPVIEELRLPAVAIGDPCSSGHLPAVWTQDDVAMASAVRYLAETGHSHIAHVSGPLKMAHTQIRSQSFHAEVERLGITGDQIEATYEQRAGSDALTALLQASPPTAVIFDNDLMAIGGLDAASRLGLNVPADISLIAWDDSPLIQQASPSIAAMSHDIQRIGEVSGQLMLEAIAGEMPASVSVEPATLVARASLRSLKAC